MFITEALREKVNASLSVLETRANWLVEGMNGVGDGTSPATLWAAERALHVAIECAADAANDVIDALVMRDPGGYLDILRVLMEEKVVTKAWFGSFEELVALREKLVHQYTIVTAEEVIHAAQKAHLFTEYAAALRRYLGIQG